MATSLASSDSRVTCIFFMSGFPRQLSGKEPACNAGDMGNSGSIPGWEDPLEKKMTTHSSILAREIPWTEEPGRLQFTGLQSWTQLSMHLLFQHTQGGKEIKCYEYIQRTSMNIYIDRQIDRQILDGIMEFWRSRPCPGVIGRYLDQGADTKPRSKACESQSFSHN